MKVFVTGGTGFTGPGVVKAIIANGHEVIGLCRSEKSSGIMKSLGGTPVSGDITDLEVLKKYSAECDAVVHLAFYLSGDIDFAASCAIDKAAIGAIMSSLEGTGKIYIGTTGTLLCLQPIGSPLPDETYRDCLLPPPMNLRAENEKFALSFAAKGVKTQVVRLSPCVHGENDIGFIPMWITASQKLGYVPYFIGGENQWTFVHKLDAANVYASALENGESDQIWHAAAENVKLKVVAEAIGKRLGVPIKEVETAPEALGVISQVLPANAPVKSDFTRSKLGWSPVHNTIVEDILSVYSVEGGNSWKIGT